MSYSHISNKTCGMIIESGSCANITSVIFVKKLNINTIKNERPYTRQ